ncbi:hypothetical protein D6833_12785, partial [Candidatus Parcubacteria bacterium]
MIHLHQPRSPWKLQVRSFEELLDGRPRWQPPRADRPVAVRWGKEKGQEDEKWVAVDLDWHGEILPAEEELLAWLRAWGDALAGENGGWYWRTHGGGGRIVVERTERVELFALALSEGLIEPPAGWTGIEIKQDFWAPWWPREGQHCSQPQRLRQTEGNRLLACFLDERAPGREIQDLPAPPGTRLPHTECPGDPCETDGQAPVVVYNGGIICYRCRAKGKQHWFPLKPRSERAWRLRKMAKAPLHWIQARYVLAWLYPSANPRQLKALYRQAVDSLCVFESRRSMVFN